LWKQLDTATFLKSEHTFLPAAEEDGGQDSATTIQGDTEGPGELAASHNIPFGALECFAKDLEAHSTRISRINKFKRILQNNSVSLAELRDSAWSVYLKGSSDVLANLARLPSYQR